MKDNIRNLLLVLTIGILLVATALFVLELLYPKVRSGKDFRLVEFEENSYFLYDLGITDINSDSYLDIFTSNHYATQNVWFGSDSVFKKASNAELGISPVPRFPGLENIGEPHKKTDAGLYIYWQSAKLVIENFGNASSTAVGQIRIPSPFDSISKEGSATTRSATDGGTTSLDFSIDSNSKIVLSPALVAVPTSITVNRNEYSLPIFVGHNLTAADSDEFTFFLKDRHGMAWSDLNSDGMLDLVVARGGLKGRMEDQPNPLMYKDELFVSNADSGTYSERLQDSKWDKRGCSMHQIAWIDINTDGLLDLYGTCRRLGQKNQLYLGTDESFREAASTFGLDFDHKWKGPFLWVDVDDDRDLDLLIEKEGSLWLYINNDQQWKGTEIPGVKGKAIKFAASDIDNDSDIDVYVSSTESSTLLLNNGKSFEAYGPERYGLPKKSFSSNWVDIDNDGLKDLHVLPGGIYRQQSDMKFVPSKQLALLFDIALAESRVNWFDMDNDGDRDVVMAIKYKPSFLNTLLLKIGSPAKVNNDWRLYLYENRLEAGNWIEVDFRQKESGQNIHGAVVEVRSGDSSYTATLGESEGSHFSQGHFRLYFGLGQHKSIDAVKITWPNNSGSEISSPTINNLYFLPEDAQPDQQTEVF